MLEVQKQLLSKSTPMLKMQTVAFYSHPYVGGTNSCFLKASLHRRYKQLFCKSTPYAGGTNISLLNQPYAGSTSLCWWYNPTLVELTPLTSPPLIQFSNNYTGGLDGTRRKICAKVI